MLRIAIVLSLVLCSILYVFLINLSRKIKTRGTSPLILLQISIALWSFAYAMELASDNIPAMNAWGLLQYAGITTAPVFWFLFAMDYSGVLKHLRKRFSAFLFLIPAATWILLATNETHHLYYAFISLNPAGPFPLRTLVPGAWFHIFWFYSHVCLFSGLSVLALTLWNSKTPYRKQQYTILSAAVPPILLNILYIAGFRPFGIIDLTPFAFVASGLILAWGMVRYRLLDLAPVARSTIVDNLVSPVLVLDLQQRVLDINPSGLRLLECDMKVVGGDIDSVAGKWSELSDFLQTGEPHGELALARENDRTWWDVSRTPLFDKRRVPMGEMLVFHDITRRKHMEKKLKQSATHDALTGLCNRDHFEEMIDSVEQDTETPIAVMMMDLNGLKTLNDTYGHRAGDTYLRETAQLLRKVFENRGFLARIGGDEFAFVGTAIDGDAILSLENELRNSIRQSKKSIDLSIGSATREKGQTIRDALDTADKKMYEEKGRR